MKKSRYLTIVLILIGGVVIAYITNKYFDRAKACLIESTNDLVLLYPELAELHERQQDVSEKLLSFHREQDIRVNDEISNGRISPEQALEFSVLQINQIAKLRKQQEEEFITLCQQLVTR